MIQPDTPGAVNTATPATDHGGAAANAGPRRSLAVTALLIGLLTLLADQVAGIVRMSATRAELSQARTAQEQPLEQARRIEQQLDALATGTAELSTQGNPQAAAIIATLQAQGVSINQQSKAEE